MSGTITTTPADGFATAAYTPQERRDIRRFCGYGAYGQGASGFQNWRFFQAYGTLEYKMTNDSAEDIQQTRLFLSQLYPLEQAIPNASSGLDTAKAAVFTRNPQEMTERKALFDEWRRRFCEFLGIPPGPALGEQGSARIII